MRTGLLQELKERRSVREFTDEPVSELDLASIIEGGAWAPSAKNTQPWKFVLIQDGGLRSILSELTLYSTIVINCKALIAVYLETPEGSSTLDKIQNHQSAGAVVQNMLLVAESLGLGGVWIGEVCKNAEKVNKELGVDQKYELAAMVAIGYPAHRNQKSHRKNVNEFILKNIGG